MQTAANFLETLIERGHARITNIISARLDTYSPLPTSVSSSKSLYAIPQEQPLLSSMNVEVTDQESETDEKKVSATAPHEIQSDFSAVSSRFQPLSFTDNRARQTQIKLVSPIVEFKYKDFIPLLQKAADAGNTELHEKVQKLLKKASAEASHQEKEGINRLHPHSQ